MKKRIASLAMALVFLCMAFSSCGKTEPREREMVISKGDYFLWHDLYFYLSPTVEDDWESMTLKYFNILSDGSSGVPVYSDPFNGGGDPFSPKANNSSLAIYMMVLVDEEATEKNGGIPVLIVALPFKDPEETEKGALHYRLASYNMGTGKLDILCEDIGSDIGTIALYGENIYFIRATSKNAEKNIYDMINGTVDIENTLFALPKEGGEPKKVPLSIDEARFDLCCTWKGKIYVRTGGTNRIYRYDPKSERTELACNITSEIDPGWLEPILYVNGYVYYKENKKTITKDGYNDSFTFDLRRKPLEGSKEPGEEEGEVVLRDINAWILQSENKIFYFDAFDGNPFEKMQYDGSVLRFYDTDTGKSGIVYDYSDKKGIRRTVYEINEKYAVVNVAVENSEEVSKTIVINLQTGEQREIEDI